MQKSVIYNTYRYRTLFLGFIFFSFITAVFVGFGLPAAQNCIIIPTDPFEKGGIIENVVGLCALDVALFWLLSFPLCRTMTIAFSSAVFFLRGLVMGNCVGVICVNSVSFEVVLMFCAYCVVTLLAVIYDIMLNFYEKENPCFRFLSCIIVTGAVIIIKISSVLIIN